MIKKVILILKVQPIFFASFIILSFIIGLTQYQFWFGDFSRSDLQILKEDIALVEIFREYLKTNKITNCQVLNTKFNEIKLEKKFDHIFINGAINQFPFYLTKYLNKDGKIFSIYTESKFPSYFCKFTLKNNDEYEKTQLFEASAPLLYNLKSNQVKFIF